MRNAVAANDDAVEAAVVTTWVLRSHVVAAAGEGNRCVPEVLTRRVQVVAEVTRAVTRVVAVAGEPIARGPAQAATMRVDRLS